MKKLLRQIALKAYWSAKTRRQERWAYWCARKLGLPPSYGEETMPDFWDYCFPMICVGERLPNYRNIWEHLR